MNNEEEFLRLSGLTAFNPVQKESIKAGVLNGESLVVSAPTASGKTLVAASAALMTLESGFDVAVMAPTEILAEQLWQNFRKWFVPQEISFLQ